MKSLFAAAAVLALAAPATSEATGYSVSATTSDLSAPHAGYTTCSYNTNNTGCSNLANGTGTLSTTTPGATSVTVTAGQSGQSAAGPFVSTTSRVTSDLSTGSLHLYGQDSGVNGNYTGGAGNNSSAEISDTLHFFNAAANADTVTTISVAFSIKGLMQPTGTSTDGGSAGELYGYLFLRPTDGSANTAGASFDIFNNSSTDHVTNANLGADNGVWMSNADFTSNIDNITIRFIGQSITENLDLIATLQCSDGMLCDFGDTAKLTLSLPTGTTFTSDSGVFLTSGMAPSVPEPATWTLMLAGFGGLGAALRERRRGRVQAIRG